MNNAIPIQLDRPKRWIVWMGGDAATQLVVKHDLAPVLRQRRQRLNVVMCGTGTAMQTQQCSSIFGALIADEAIPNRIAAEG